MNPLRKALIGGTIVASTLIGGALGAALLGGAAHAAEAATTTAAPAAADPAGPRDPAIGGHMANGVTETLLTGDTATKVKDAALAAVPGGTVQRVENDAEGATYEAHVLKADGTPATVKLDGSFKVTGVEEGGRGPR